MECIVGGVPNVSVTGGLGKKKGQNVGKRSSGSEIKVSNLSLSFHIFKI
jgi:hypothetical protein